MGQSHRVKRPMPERTDPDRGWRNALGARQENGAAGAGGSPEGQVPQPTEGREASYDAINDAYRVIDEYLRQGQRMAEKIWLPAMGENGPINDLGRVFERFMRSAGDMGTAWLEMMGKWSSPPIRRENAQGGAGPFSAGRPHPSRHYSDEGVNPAAQATPVAGVSVHVESTRGFQIWVDLFDPNDPGDLELKELVAADGSLPSIADVRFEREPANKRVVVRVVVPDGHPPGVYNGMLIARGTHRPRGTISLSLA